MKRRETAADSGVNPRVAISARPVSAGSHVPSGDVPLPIINVIGRLLMENPLLQLQIR